MNQPGRSPNGFPEKQGLYDPSHEHDACGVGFIADLHGRKSHAIVRSGAEILRNLAHRGACGCEANTGDGAGILFQIPDRFFRSVLGNDDIHLPPAGEYGVGMVFLPTDRKERDLAERLFERAISSERLHFLGWRTVPVDDSNIGFTAKASQPVVRQLFIGRGDGVKDAETFERRLYLVRKTAERLVRESSMGQQRDLFYVCSLSSQTLVYKGMLTPEQVEPYYPDLVNSEMESAIALVHSRFSTNTFPSWARAHPYRVMCHNGEINTLRGNVNWMRARESALESRLFGADVRKLRPVIDETGSDSSMFDNVLEMLWMGGRPIEHAVMMMVPEPWRGHEGMSAERKDFYRFHSCLMEPWDGPAAIMFTDGRKVGTVLDRNGLRPLRYYVTKDGRVIMGSEAGVLPEIPPELIETKGRIQPGRMFLVDLEQGRIVPDEEIKGHYAKQNPYGKWLADNLTSLDVLPPGKPAVLSDSATVEQRQETFGYNSESLNLIVPMAESGAEAIGSMGDDTPLAVLSNRARPLYDYFKQLFAQVTNPPVDAIREELIFDIGTAIGKELNLFEARPESAHQIELDTPFLRNDQLETLRALDGTAASRGFKSITLPMLYEIAGNGPKLESALAELQSRAEEAVEAGHDIIILSDRNHGATMVPIPALLAVSAVHHHLLRCGTRTRTSIVVESGEPREVHHVCLLLGFGASAINPYLAFETIAEMHRQGMIKATPEKAEKNFIKGLSKGVTKVLSKMGISTVQSYHGAQVFEAIGLDPDLVNRYFTGTTSRISGIGIDVVAEEVARRHARAFVTDRKVVRIGLDPGGSYKWRKDGEFHLTNPKTIHLLQDAVRTNNYEKFKEFSKLIDEQSRDICTLRGLMSFRKARPPVPIEEVESEEAIVKRFKTGAMSYGSISKEAHEAIAIAMNRLGGKSNTGEGGEDPARFVPDANGDSRRSAIKQVASGRFGVTSEYLTNADELQIKMAQGAKPGEGGQLPGSKVYPWIAKVRHSTPGVGLISPPPHHDIYSIEDLAQLIHDLKCANNRARISVKLVAEVGVGTVAAGVAKAKADVVLVSGYDGGTGASPLTSIKHAGVPWELGLAETHQTLVLNDLRSRIYVETDGQLKTGRDVIVATLLGAEEYGFATTPLVTLGCVMMRVCHLNTCPVGVATQNPELRKRFTGDPQHLVNFMRFVARQTREWMAELGFRTINEMVGRTEMLEMREAVSHWKARGLDFSAILHKPNMPRSVGRYRQIAQDHGLGTEYDDTTLIGLCRPALDKRKSVEANLPVRNVNRTVGTRLGSEVTRAYGVKGLPEDTIKIHFRGSAGQSFMAFVPKGVTFTLEGDANDYVGKGLSGGKLVVFPPREATFAAEDNVIVGNVALYGATGGEAYLRGMAGERFCVRNSGVDAVVEGVGDHGCEYMTGGRVVILGQTGRNFAAGMSGGIAYILDESRDFASRCNMEMVAVEPLSGAEEIELVQGMLARHVKYTQSERAKTILAGWQEWKKLFVRVIPHDYRNMLAAQAEMRKLGLSPEEAELAAFEQNLSKPAAAGK
ncbi:MAG: glutamate synthase large subunit [Deltaproteobacteria bacterium]|nr:glutamate synthase large subunit [Deltaproteobacteria bacterium]